MRVSDRPADPVRGVTTTQILVSTTGLTLLLLTMIEAVFLFW
jgi:hypothetical protein